MSRKKRPMQKMSQIPESLTAGWEEVSSCIQLTAPALKAGIGVECRVLWVSSSLHWKDLHFKKVQCSLCFCSVKWSAVESTGQGAPDWWPTTVGQKMSGEGVSSGSSCFNWFLGDCNHQLQGTPGPSLGLPSSGGIFRGHQQQQRAEPSWANVPPAARSLLTQSWAQV